MTQTQTNDGINLHVSDSGQPGQPVLLIHGWPMSGAAWANQVQALQASGYRPITYDRRGFGDSDKPSNGYEYDTLAADLNAVIEDLDLHDVVLVGFSMGGGEVARYINTFGTDRLSGAVFAAAIPPYLAHSDDNPEGPLTQDVADGMEDGLKTDRESFFDEFTTNFFSANGTLMVDDATRQNAIALARQSDQTAALACMEAFGTTDFRDDLPAIDVPTLIIHGDADAIVPLEGSAQRTHQAVADSQLHVIKDGPHGITDSHAREFNEVLLKFLDNLKA